MSSRPSPERYTPGHGSVATDYMARRTLQTHGAFFIPYLEGGASVLDCGCGPGTITAGIAERVAPGPVVGVDRGVSQVERARAAATQAGHFNASFRVADVYALPFRNGDFERVFSHAMMEHLADAPRAIAEMHRVLAPGGVIGVCSPDWNGFVLAPPSPALSQAAEAYQRLQSRNGGDVHVGAKLGTLLRETGFEGVRMGARYECAPPEALGEFLALQLDEAGESDAARAFREWLKDEAALFAIAWIWATGRKRP